MAKDKTAGLKVYQQPTDLMTKDKLIKLFPNKKRTITDKTVELINVATGDPQFDGYSFENTLVEYRKVMDRRSGSLADYICAIKFCAYVESGMNDTEAYFMAFSHRDLIRNAIGKPTDSNEYVMVVSSAHRYKKTPMVQDIMTMADVPMYLLKQSTRYAAVGVLEDEMMNAAFSKDRIAAATAILKEIKEPDNKRIELEIGLSSDAHKQIEKTNTQMAEIASNQLKLLQQGYSIDDVQKLNIKQETQEVIEADIDE